MYDHYRSSRSPVAVVFFIMIFIFGNLILLNLFLAILLKNFEEPPGQDDEEVFDEFETKTEPKIITFFKKICFCCKKPSNEEEEKNKNEIEMTNEKSFKSSKISEINKNNDEESQESDEDISQDQVGQRKKKRRGTGIIPEQTSDELNTKFGQQERNGTEFQSNQSQKGKKELDNAKEKNEKLDKKSKTLSTYEMMQQELSSGKKKNFSISTIKLRQIKGKDEASVIEKLHGNSCYLLNDKNWFRITCGKIVKHRHFDNFVLFLILFSTILLAIEDPYEEPGTMKVRILAELDLVLSFTFLCELLIKVIVLGFAFNGEDSYLRNAWNIMDFVIVFFSMVSIVFQDVDLGPIKVLRMLRVLRPLRMISRNPGMKIAIQSLINAIPDIGNVMVVSLLFILLFSILGTNFYKGTFFKCLMDNIPEEFQENILNKVDCMDYGGDWVNEDQNFDNIKSSLITLFNVMTTEGWIGVMWNAVDSTRINEMPKKNNSKLQILFFMFYMVACSLFVLNMFVGIVINVFNREKDTLYMNHKFTETQIDWCESMIYVYQQKPLIKYKAGVDRMRDMMHSIATNTIFDTFIFLCIIFNTICLTLTWYNEPVELHKYLEAINLVFNIIYTIEATIKMSAFGLDYFKDGWNSFDFVIVVSAWVGFIADVLELQIGDFDKLTGSLRISRIFKIVKKYKSLRILLSTFVGAIQQLTNVGGLLFLFLFLYSVLGVFTFSGVKFQDSVNQHANFTTFHMALITLFRMATGESWHELMYDCSRQKSITFDCKSEKQTYAFIQENGRQECGSELAAYMYFISFMIVVSFIFLNLFIAIILESFNTTQIEEGLKVGVSTVARFNDHWSEFDPKGTCLIAIDDIRPLIKRIIEEEANMIIQNRIKVQMGEIDNFSYSNMIFMFELYKNDYLSGLSMVRQAEIQNIEMKKGEDQNEVGSNHNDSRDQLNPSLSKIVNQGYNNVSDAGTQSIAKVESDNEDVTQQQPNLKYDDSNDEEIQAMEKLLSSFIGSLRIPCYQNVTSYYYYDVIEALSRDMFQRMLIEKQIELVEEEKLEQEKMESNVENEASEESHQRHKEEIEEGVAHQYHKKEHEVVVKHAEKPLISTNFPYGDNSNEEETKQIGNIQSESENEIETKRSTNLVHPGRSQTKLEKLIMDQVDDIWELYDTDLSGVLDKIQTKKFVIDTLKNLRPDDKFSDEAFADVFKSFDKDNSGNVEKKEMFYFIKHIMIGFDQEEMEKEDIRIAELEPILERLEEIGNEFNVQKYKMMLELRNERINKVKKQLDIHNFTNIIDSSQVQAAHIIRNWFKAWKTKRAIKKIRELSREQLKSIVEPFKKEPSSQENSFEFKDGGAQEINSLKSILKIDINKSSEPNSQRSQIQRDNDNAQRGQLVAIKEDVEKESGERDEIRDTTNLSGVIGISGGQGPFFMGQSAGQISNSPRFEGDEQQVIDNSSKNSFMRDSGPGNKQGEGAFAEEEGKDEAYNLPLVMNFRNPSSRENDD